MQKWTIIPLHAGDSEVDKSLLTYLRNFGQTIRVPNIIFVLQSGEKAVIVDTSFESVERTKRINKQNVWMTERQKPKNLLREIGLNPTDVKIVILTHLHYDHCGNNRLFPNAYFIVQREELRYALTPNPGQEAVFHSPLIGEKPGFLGHRLKIIDGDEKIIPGISVIFTPGHTPGSQSVLVDTLEGIYCIAGDAVCLYENLEENIPPGLHEVVSDCFKSMDKMRRMADFIIPGHDKKIFERKDPIVIFPKEAKGFATGRIREDLK